MTRVLVNSNGKAFTTSNNRVLSSSGITPSGSISITENDTYDVTSYASAVVNVSGGGSSPVIETLTVTPSTSAQTIIATSGVDGYSPVNVSAVTASIDQNITAGNIKLGVSILGIQGNVVELNGETQTVSLTSTAGDTFTPTSPKNGITSITVTPTNENRSVTPSANQQVLSVNSGYSGNGIITVAGDANLVAGNIKNGVSIFNVQGTYTGGSSILITKSITQNGTYNASSDNADGYSSVTVNVSDYYGLSIANFWGYPDSNGVFQHPIPLVNPTFSGIIEFPDSEPYFEWSPDQAFMTLPHSFVSGTLSFPDLVTIGSNAMNNMFTEKRITAISFPNLESVGVGGMAYTFYDNSIGPSVYFPSLSYIGPGGLQEVFSGNGIWDDELGDRISQSLENIYFPALTSNSFDSGDESAFEHMLDSDENVTVHFPSNLQNVIGNWQGVIEGFGGLNTTILFDLPATE